MADSLEGNAFSSPSKRLKLGVNSYAVVLDNVEVRNGIGSINRCDIDDAIDGIREKRDDAPPSSSSPPPPSFSRSPSSSNDDDYDAFVERRRTKTGVTSSSDLKDGEEVYLNNCGDSGFNEMTPPSSTGCVETNSSTDLDEPDSSTACGLRRERNEMESKEEDDDDDEACEVASTISHLSGISDLSEMSGQEWKATAGPMSWVQRQMISGISPRILLQQILPQGSKIPDQVDDLTLWKVIVNIMNEPPRRKKLLRVNTFDDVLNLLRSSRKIIVLTGAGVSVSCGIPDFRSHDGIYARLAKDFPDLPDPQAMFDIQYFKRDPRPFYKFAKEIFPGLFEPSACHRFIKLLEDMGRLLRNYTQNIDTLEQIVGIEKVIECHGSFATASCLRCKYKVSASAIRDDIFNQTIPKCPKCKSNADELAIMKPDIVFFGEGLSDEFHSAMNVDKDQCDLLIVIGSSLKVRPVALIPSSIPSNVPQILINRERLPHMNFDVELLGDCDIIINEICHRLGNGWRHLCCRDNGLVELSKLPTDDQSASEPSEGVAEVTSEHSNDPCDSTSFPHRNRKYKEASDCAVDCSSSDEAGGCGSRCNRSFVATVTTNPDSTNVVSCEEKLSMRASTSNEEPTTIHKETAEEKDTIKNDDNDDCKPQGSISALLPDDTYLFCRPNRYVFRGAAVYELDSDSDSDSESGADGDDTSSSESCSELSDTDFVDNFEVERLQNESEENGRL